MSFLSKLKGFFCCCADDQHEYAPISSSSSFVPNLSKATLPTASAQSSTTSGTTFQGEVAITSSISVSLQTSAVLTPTTAASTIETITNNTTSFASLTISVSSLSTSLIQPIAIRPSAIAQLRGVFPTAPERQEGKKRCSSAMQIDSRTRLGVWTEQSARLFQRRIPTPVPINSTNNTHPSFFIPIPSSSTAEPSTHSKPAPANLQVKGTQHLAKPPHTTLFPRRDQKLPPRRHSANQINLEEKLLLKPIPISPAR